MILYQYYKHYYGNYIIFWHVLNSLFFFIVPNADYAYLDDDDDDDDDDDCDDDGDNDYDYVNAEMEFVTLCAWSVLMLVV